MKKLLTLLLLFIPLLGANVNAPPIPVVDLTINGAQTPTQLVKTLNIVILMTLLALAPSLVLVMTSFVRLLIVFAFLRQAMGTQQLPPSQILVSLAMVLTFFIMQPYATKAYKNGIEPYMNEQIGYEQAFERSVKPFKNFMLNNTREKDLALFYRIRQLPNPNTIEDVPITILIPAFMLSELKTAFEIGFLLFLPFLVVDMVVASILMSMGMMMIPPMMLSLPFKLILFVVSGGWELLIKSLVVSYR